MAREQNHVIVNGDTEGQTTQSQWFQYESQPISQLIWGRLRSKQSTLKSLDLCNSKFTAGRSETNDLILSREDLPERVMIRLSKNHFEISRDLSSHFNPVFIKDHSLNGTYINNERLGRGNSRILKSGDAISVAHPTYKIYIFTDLNHNPKCSQMPDVITNNYYISDQLGSGACGVVHKIYNLRTLKPYAMKVIKKNLFADKKITNHEQVANEVNIMKSLHHPCVIEMHDIVDKPDAVYIILELMTGGDLLHRITGKKYLTEEESKFFFYQMCHAVKYLHDVGITHRDIKPDNILLESADKHTLLKISDFGLSKFVHNNTVMQTICGTPSYVAPEVLNTNGKGAYTKKIDIWSLGVVLFTCLSGVLPFSDNYGTQACEQIKKGRFSFKHYTWKTVSFTAKKLISQMLTVDANQRPNIDEILNHEWFIKDSKIIQSARLVMNMESITNNDETDDENFLEPPPKRVRRI